MKNLIAFIKALFADRLVVAKMKAHTVLTAVATRLGLISFTIRMKSTYIFEARDPFGYLLWREVVSNIVVDVGLDDILDKYFKGSAYTASHFVGLTDGAPTVAAGDTMASHAGWVEVTAYSQATRPLLNLADAVSGQSVDNSSNVAVYGINANGTVIGGGFIVTDNTKGGTAGVLYGVAAFGIGNKTLDDGDTLNVTATLTSAAS